MWNPFKKQKVIDFTKEKIKVPENVRARIESEYKDLTPMQDSGSDSALGFLGNLASSSPALDSNANANPQHLKVKIEDFEYKLDSFSRRISSILDRIDLAEKKIERLERKGV